jgi:hypothetical protein
MACPECEHSRKQYFSLRRAVLRLARRLKGRRKAGPSLTEWVKLIGRDAGLTIHG